MQARFNPIFKTKPVGRTVKYIKPSVKGKVSNNSLATPTKSKPSVGFYQKMLNKNKNNNNKK